MPVAQLTLSETQQAIANLWGTDWLTMSARMSEYGLTPAEMASNEFLRQWSGGAVEPIYARNGETILGYNFRADATTVRTGLNSNTSIVARGNINHAPATTIETVGANAGKVKVSRLSGLGSKIVTGASKLAVPLTLVAVGATLGKTIDEGLYNFNPNFWDEIGLSTLNPNTWNNIVGGDGTLAGSFFNAIFGIDPNTGETQAYIDANAFAYLSYCMQQGGIFSTGQQFPQNQSTGTYVIETLADGWDLINAVVGLSGMNFTYNTTVVNNIDAFLNAHLNTRLVVRVYNHLAAFNAWGVMQIYCFRNQTVDSTVTLGVSITGQPSHNVYGRQDGLGNCSCTNSQNSSIGIAQEQNQIGSWLITDNAGKLHYYGCNAGIVAYNIPGIGNQEGATLPNFSGLTENEYLPYLEQTYPNIFNNAINYPVVQPDGTVTNHEYIPITLPIITNPADLQPTTNGATQQHPQIDPSTDNQNLLDLLTKILQQPMTEPISDNPQPPQNPTDMGDGSSPVPSFPSGSASSLWKIYHPTQAQIDSFGGWLWSSNFIDQILKIFNNPMEAVIGLHKVYATPIDAGNATIKVGYLDSQIPSAYIEQQYIDVSCGSVNLYEQFGNVFDYSPFTDVKLYLPFIGIVPLNIADVMRSTIAINYGVDVLTGACLAQVEVSRDGNSSVLYQYSGNCAVQYPISSGSYMGIVSSIISVAGGVAATVASGGAAAPLALGAMGGIMSAHTSVQNSGGFSGNAGAMGGKIPYLIITRPQTKVADNAESLQGYRTNSYTTIGECEGYIKADSVHIINVNATDEELTEINNLILSGIII